MLQPEEQCVESWFGHGWGRDVGALPANGELYQGFAQATLFLQSLGLT